jgi:enoyl-CoA hydratase/carnithine racemase
MTQRLLSPRQAERVVLDAGLHSLEASISLGLIDEIAPSIDAAREKATKLEALPKEAYAFAKLALRELPPIDATANQLFQEQIIPSWISPELKKKLLAVLAR